MTTATAFRLHRHVFVDEGPLLIRVALVANRIATGHGSDLADGGGAMNVVAVAALEQALRNPVVIRFGEVGFGRGVASIAELRLFLYQQLWGFLGVMRRMAVETTDVIAGMGRTCEVPLLMVFPVAAQATSAGLLAGEVLEADDLRDVSSTGNVFGSGTVTTFTPMPVFESRLEVRGRLKVLVIKLFMTGLAHIGADVFGCRFARQGIFLLLTGGNSRLK